MDVPVLVKDDVAVDDRVDEDVEVSELVAVAVFEEYTQTAAH